jgi:hypothetical protein
MFRKISMRDVFGEHLATLYNNRSDARRISLSDLAVFFGLPVVVGIIVGVFHPNLETGEALTGVSILAGLSFGAVVFVFDLRLRMAQRWKAGARALMLLDQLFKNLLYSVFVAVILVVVSLIPEGVGWWSRVYGGFFTAVALHYVLTMLMCIKRLSAAFREATR